MADMQRKTPTNKKRRVGRESRFLEKQRAADQARAREAAVNASAMNKEWVLDQLREIVDRSMQAVPVLDRQGNPTGEFRYQPAPAIRAAELIGKELGMFRNDRDENSFRLDRQRLERMTEEERIAENAELLAQAKQAIRQYRAAKEEREKGFGNRLNGGQGSGCPDSKNSEDPPTQEGGGDAGTEHRRQRQKTVPR
jgi:hypothetical protein